MKEHPTVGLVRSEVGKEYKKLWIVVKNTGIKLFLLWKFEKEKIFVLLLQEILDFWIRQLYY